MRATRSLCAIAAAALIAAGGIAAAPAASAAPAAVERVTAPDSVALSVAVSARTFPAKTPTVYLATDAGYADALAAGGAAGSRSPILLVDPAGLDPVTQAELQRLAPTKIVILGGTDALPPAIATDVAAAVPSALVTRIAGADRYETATAVSGATFGAASTAYVATGAGFADALSAGPAAAGASPILLTRLDALPQQTATELQRLGVQRVVVLGGTAVISDAVIAAIESTVPNASVSRVAGVDRYSTAAKVARTIAPSSDGTIVVAPGSSFAAALVAAPAAARAHAPLLLIDGSPVSALTAELGRRGANHLLVVGDVDDGAVAAVVAAANPVLPDALPGASTAVQTAQAQLGKPYEWGAEGPDSFDCSGLVMFSWATGGVSLPRVAEAQAYAVMTVPFTQLQPGDLLFYGSPIYHVGMYLADGTMIEAAHTGVPVRTASIWRSDLIAAGRPTA